MPSGTRLRRGHGTVIEFSLMTTIQLWERSVKPPGIDGGTPINISTHRSVTWDQMFPRALRTLTAATGQCNYDEAVFPNIVSMCNKNQQFSVIFPTGRPITFWGWLQSFEFVAIDSDPDGNMPVADFSIQPSNTDNTGAEVGPTVGTSSTTATTTTTTFA